MRGRIHQPQDREYAMDCASGLANDGDGLALIDVIADAVDRLDQAG
jgi:hypothetical protein